MRGRASEPRVRGAERASASNRRVATRAQAHATTRLPERPMVRARSADRATSAQLTVAPAKSLHPRRAGAGAPAPFVAEHLRYPPPSPNRPRMNPARATIRPMIRPEIDLAVDWAAAEGWNPGLADAACFR